MSEARRRMSRQLDVVAEERVIKRNEQLIRAVEFELSGVIEVQGMSLLGFSIKIEPWECLMTLRVLREDNHLVGFVGSDTVANCIVKSVAMVRRDKVVWREDKYRANGG
jgi:hypothetical protein